MKISSKNILLFLLLIISGCQQCILEHKASPKFGFDPQSKSIGSEEFFSLDIIVNEIESPFFGMSFQIEYDSSKIDLSCSASNIEDPLFGNNYLANFIKPENEKIIYSSISLFNGQDPISGSGNIAVCNGFSKSSGTAQITFIPNSFYFINEYGDELLNAVNLDSSYNANYNQLDSSAIIYEFEILDARIDIDQPGIIDN